MKRTEPQSIGDVLRLTIQECNMTDKLNEQRAIALWPLIIGEHLASRCGRPTVRDKVMYVPVNTAPLRQELTMNRSSLIRIINDKIGRQVLTEIRFIG